MGVPPDSPVLPSSQPPPAKKRRIENNFFPGGTLQEQTSHICDTMQLGMDGYFHCSLCYAMDLDMEVRLDHDVYNDWDEVFKM
jgi:hypothetical protein